MRSLLTLIGAATSLATLFGFLGRFAWFLDLFSHFRPQYFCILLISGLLLLAMHQRRLAVTFIVFAAINSMVMLPLYFRARDLPCKELPVTRLMLLNVNSRLGDVVRIKRLILDTDPDIVVLEEISSLWIKNLKWLKNSHPYFITRAREDNFGIGLFSKFPLDDSEIAHIGSAHVPSILATVKTEQASLRVVATHPLPPISGEYSRLRNEQLEELASYASSSLPLILLGDLNTTPWNYHFSRLLARSGLMDSAKGYGVQASWPSYNPLMRIPIDHLLHSPDIVILNREIGPDVSSDHYPVIVDFAIKTDL